MFSLMHGLPCNLLLRGELSSVVRTGLAPVMPLIERLFDCLKIERLALVFAYWLNSVHFNMFSARSIFAPLLTSTTSIRSYVGYGESIAYS